MSGILLDKIRTMQTHAINLTSEFPCGSGEDLREVEPGHYALDIRQDPVSVKEANGYDYFFCVRLTNVTDRRSFVVVDATRPGCNSKKGNWSGSRVPIFIAEHFGTWYVLDGTRSCAGHDCHRMQLWIEAKQTIYLCNSLPNPPSGVQKWINDIRQRHKNSTSLSCIGTSSQGRDIMLLTITDSDVENNDKDRVLITSGFHPAEPDWLATTEIVKKLLGLDDWARELQRNFIFDVIVQVNPDGAELGHNGCTSDGVNMYWDFRRLKPDASPEALSLWAWIEAHPPALYLDFHCYVHQLHKDFRPYIRPRSDYSKLARPIVKGIDKRLIAACNGRYVQGPSTNLPSTLAAQITQMYGTVTYTKLHLHLAHGVYDCRRLGLEMFRIIVDGARAHRPLQPKIWRGTVEAKTLEDNVLWWWEQSRTGLRVRSLSKRVSDWLDKRLNRKHKSVQLYGSDGLPRHWHGHLWSLKKDGASAISGGSRVESSIND